MKSRVVERTSTRAQAARKLTTDLQEFGVSCDGAALSLSRRKMMKGWRGSRKPARTASELRQTLFSIE
ncbi:hypothetical protein Taro_022019 [Colocasia esculenta]|uniref:Uncharacterized protein n=1 Tax=Colocasia esculenta TaxID=4460 RepID=A0A843V0N1_COLES|nr:hypothetical protein [Colocasia esculenta]